MVFMDVVIHVLCRISNFCLHYPFYCATFIYSLLSNKYKIFTSLKADGLTDKMNVIVKAYLFTLTIDNKSSFFISNSNRQTNIHIDKQTDSH